MDPAAFVQQYVALHRSGDIDGLLALHIEDAEFIIPGQDPLRGRAALRDLFSRDVMPGSELIMEDIHIEGNTIVINRIVGRNKWFEAMGVPEAQYRPDALKPLLPNCRFRYDAASAQLWLEVMECVNISDYAVNSFFVFCSTL